MGVTIISTRPQDIKTHISSRRPVTARNRPLSAASGARDFEDQALQNLHFKKEINKLKKEAIRAHAHIARLEQQKNEQAKEIASLLQGYEPSLALKREHTRSLIVKKLREHIFALRAQLNEKESIIHDLRNSQRNAVLLELETAKEEFFIEAQRLRQKVEALSHENEREKANTIHNITKTTQDHSSRKELNASHLLLIHSNLKNTNLATSESKDTKLFHYSVDSDNDLHISPESSTALDDTSLHPQSCDGLTQ